ncbi:hydrogenase formation protein HypD [Candidatus Methylomicrobium oryzae]|jgi:hydrogenase expression/formation protein HypD|uniref:hydrogenase formation protein HypD n=1 Tax=Candidatus Methylomicrobium oryzae TaxID=2802053 RepID=UPI0019248CDE|nr:hydrogenase formation protein HypD [Methylomicrobium sp. RS1]MBL1262410.1 hydrogenase formation protein HypD [Methylomicrobium sp. RS1]
MNMQQAFRDPAAAKQLAAAIAAITTRPWNIMEVCGGQTHSIIKYGIDQLLPEGVNLIHGPGCPVCVTPLEYIDKALAIAALPGVILCSFGDMLRVPGSQEDLLGLKAQGADVRIVYSPTDALEIARKHPDQEVVFFGVGFETTAPTIGLAAYQAKQSRLKNFSLLVCHVRVPPVIEALLDSSDNRVQGFLGAGHVCTIMGCGEYVPLAGRYRVPIVITGFEPVDVLHGLYACIKQLEEGRFEVENAYRRVVREQGNPAAQQLLRQVFEVVDRNWRGLGMIRHGGLALNDDYRDFNAELRFSVDAIDTQEPVACRSGDVLKGLLKPSQCPEFGTRCTPEKPLGATMVSSEGACAAYYRYRRLQHG